ncbi:MAG TPA: PorV/PorQ family protein [Bacteroidota bacterium]
MRALRLIATLVVSSVLTLAQTKTGTSVSQFLLIEPSARVAAMGNAGVTVYGEIQSVYYNPASAGYLTQNGVQFTHSNWIADISYDYAALAISLGETGTFLATVTSLNSGEIAVTTVDQPHGTGEFYSVTDLAVGVGFGRRISDRFSVGFQINYVQEVIWHSSMTAFGLNVGTLYKIADDGLLIGASISNFGTRGMFDGRDLRIQYDQDPDKYGDNSALPASQVVEDFPLPIIFRVGLGYPVTLFEGNVLRFAVDAFHPSDNTESISLGGEWAYENMFFVRGGYQNMFLQDSETGLTFGAGVRYALQASNVSFDYAWADFGRLIETHRFTLGISF